MSILTLDMQAMLFPPETEEGGEAKPKIKLRAVAHALIFYQRMQKNAANNDGQTVLQVIGESSGPSLRESKGWELAGDEEETVVVCSVLCFGCTLVCADLWLPSFADEDITESVPNRFLGGGGAALGRRRGLRCIVRYP